MAMQPNAPGSVQRSVADYRDLTNVHGSGIQVVPAHELGINQSDVDYFIEELHESKVFGRVVALDAETEKFTLQDTDYDLTSSGWLDGRSTFTETPNSINPFTRALRDFYLGNLASGLTRSTHDTLRVDHYALKYSHPVNGEVVTIPESRDGQSLEGFQAVLAVLGKVELAVHGGHLTVPQGDVALVRTRDGRDAPEWVPPVGAGYIGLRLEARRAA